MKKIQNKIAVVTSSEKGIGLACARILSENGAVVYIASQYEDKALEAVNLIIKEGGIAKYIAFCPDDSRSYEVMIDKVVEQEGEINILINNYGIENQTLDKDLLEGDTANFFDIVQKNLQSVYLPCKAAISHMIKSGGGNIVNISALGSIKPGLTRIGYNVSKAAINSLTQNIAIQYANQNIRCNAVLPGFVCTKEVFELLSDEFKEAYLSHIPLNRMGLPEDIANAVLYFSADDSSFITGTIFEVAGGLGLATPDYMN